MKVKDIIQLNNDKREQLNEDNLTVYEDMLLYIRLASSKSERHTEEILLELLEHLLLAQDEGRTAKDVFGDDPEQYCKELIGEIPAESRKEQLRFSLYIILQFLAIISFINGIVGFGLYHFFSLNSSTTTFHIGSGIVIVILNIFILVLLIVGVLRWLKASAFKTKKKNKWIEFLQIWLFSTLSIGLFFLVIYFMPAFGPVISLPTIVFAGVGVVLYLLSNIFKR